MNILVAMGLSLVQCIQGGQMLQDRYDMGMTKPEFVQSVPKEVGEDVLAMIRRIPWVKNVGSVYAEECMDKEGMVERMFNEKTHRQSET